MLSWKQYALIVPALLVQAFSACTSSSDELEDTENVNASIAFTVSQAANQQTRLSDEMVQEQPSSGNNSYRGLKVISMIPFAVSRTNFTEITAEDKPLRLLDVAQRNDFRKENSAVYGAFYLYKSYSMMRGINAFLVYGKAPEEKTSEENYSKAERGSLLLPSEAELVYPDLNTLRFRPDPIYSSTTAPDEANLLAGYLNAIAKAETSDGKKWSNTSDPTLKGIFMNFTGQTNEGNIVMAGSCINVMKHVNALYDIVSKLTYPTNSEGALLTTAIINKIQNYTATGLALNDNGGTGAAWQLTAIKANGIDYPSDKGLPDGAAVLRWAKKTENSTDYEFIPQTQTTTQANINTITRYCYPMELYYYTNSRIDTSNDKVDDNTYSATTVTDWENVLKKYEYKDAQVTGNTQAVAIKKALQYAVGRLKVKMKADTGQLEDAAGNTVTLTETSFPLTGLIVCNQHPVDFNFKPVLNANEEASHADDHFIYDSQMGNYCLTMTEQQIPSTLVLQSYDAEEVTIILEFRNDSGQKFNGKDGVIYEGTKFYLIGKIKPEETTNPKDFEKRVFTQDYVTEVSLVVKSDATTKSLANAYNVLPDLLGGRLELGVELTTNWILAEPDNVLLKPE